jgi:hypothetical protein
MEIEIDIKTGCFPVGGFMGSRWQPCSAVFVFCYENQRGNLKVPNI